MTDNAQALLREIGEEFAKSGFPPFQQWSFSPEGEDAALHCRELAAQGYLQRDPKGWRLSATGAAHVLAAHPITTGAQEALERIRAAYVESGYPSYQTWRRTPENKEERGYFVELWTRGILEPKDFSRTLWSLTGYGQQLIMQAT